MHFIGIKHVFILLAFILAAVLADIVIRYPHNTKRPAAGDPHANVGKQLWHCGMHPQVIQDHPGDCPICHMALTPLNPNSATSDGEKKVLYWWDPMLGPSSISDHPGKSAMGMDMVPVYANPGGPQVQIDPALVQNMGVRTAKVTRGPLMKSVRTVGLLKLPEPGLHDVSLKIGGWIDKLYADQDGMHVVKGEPLFELYSQDLQVTEQELISAVKSAKSVDASASPAMAREAQNLIESAKRKLRLWDVAEPDIEAIASADQPPKDVPFRSPATGHIEDKVIVQGSAVQMGMKLMRVADHSKIWLDAQVYEEQLPVVKLNQSVVATVDGVPGKSFKGTVSFMYPHVDHATRTLTVRMTLDNPNFELRPGMYATVQIMTQPSPDTIQVPREAVIDTGTRQIAFVAEGEGHFTPRRVRMGIMGDNDMVQIIDGLAPGELVVTSGQFLMDVESRTIEVTQKLSAAAMTPPADSQAVETPSTAPATSPSEAVSTGPIPSAPAMSASQPAAPSTTRVATKPAEAPKLLTQVFCSMAKADWLQIGDQVINPYMGQQMSACGEVRRKLAAPPAGSELSAFVNAYLAVAKEMDADKLDGPALMGLKAAAEKLQANSYGALREAAARLADTKDLNAARSAFKAVSDQLIAALQRPMK
jgi:Cu(I)/Ag(I) efflux system membrane fusion protein/cobalt-zinc-cadmium efflux system membrane fusion protein